MALADHLSTDLLSALLDEQLENGEEGVVREHLGSCLHCRQRLEGLRRVSAGLSSLDPVAPPLVFDQAVRRRLGLEVEERGLRRRLEKSLGGPRRLSSHVGLGFALILAFAVILFFFADAIERRQARSVVVPLSRPVLESALRQVGARWFQWEGDRWRQRDIEAAPSRVVPAFSEEGQALLAELPELRRLLEDVAVVELEWRGEVVQLGVAPRPE